MTETSFPRRPSVATIPSETTIVALRPVHPGSGQGLRFTRRNAVTWDIQAIRTGRVLGAITGDETNGYTAIVEGNAIGPFGDLALLQDLLIYAFTPLDDGAASRGRYNQVAA